MDLTSKLFSQAYGSDTYGSEVYSCANNQTDPRCTTEAPKTPNLGLANIPAASILPTVVVFAIVLYISVIIILKKFRKGKNHESNG